MSGGRWGCGAIAWSGGGAVRGNVTGWSCVLAGWCVAVATCRVHGDDWCGSVSGGVVCDGNGICGSGIGDECSWDVGWSRKRRQES